MQKNISVDQSTKAQAQILPHKSNFLSPSYQHSGKCSTNAQKQGSNVQKSGASNQGLFSLLQFFLKSHWGCIYHPFRQPCVKQHWNRATAAEKTAELGFVWRTVKSKRISKLKQWKTVFVESFCPYFKNTKLWKIELEDRYVLKKPLILIWSTAFITIRKATLSPVFIPKLDEIWKSWSSNEVLGREKQMKKRGQGSVEDNLHQLKQWHFNLHSEQKFLHTVHAIHLIRVCYANSEKCRDLIAMF